MGWDFYCDPAYGRAKVLADATVPGFFNPDLEVLGHRVVGNKIWHAIKRPDGELVIYLTLIKSGGKNSGWGYKGIPDKNPDFHGDPPASLLKLLADKGSELHAEWLAKVKANMKVKAKLEPGMAVTIHGKPYVLVRKRDASKLGWIVQDPRGNIYRAARGIEVQA